MTNSSVTTASAPVNASHVHHRYRGHWGWNEALDAITIDEIVAAVPEAEAPKLDRRLYQCFAEPPDGEAERWPGEREALRDAVVRMLDWWDETGPVSWTDIAIEPRLLRATIGGGLPELREFVAYTYWWTGYVAVESRLLRGKAA